MLQISQICKKGKWLTIDTQKKNIVRQICTLRKHSVKIHNIILTIICDIYTEFDNSTKNR